MKVELLDTTLRDGQQGPGISFTLQDKKEIARLVAELGIDLIEVGNPFSNEKDRELLSEAFPFHPEKIVAFGSTRRKNESASNSPALASLAEAKAETVTVFGKSSVTHVKEILKTTEEENLAMISDSVTFLKSNGKRVLFDAEHFFDGYKENADYALETLNAAYRAGADTLILCDTNGGAYPEEIAEAVKAAVEKFPVTIGIHAHNDRGLAVANTLSAIGAGARHVQGTLLGYGERCGNTSLATLLPSLILHCGANPEQKENLKNLTSVCRAIAEIINIAVPENTPFIGASAFWHKGGMHADGVMKSEQSFEHLDPSAVGNERKLVLSEMSGRSLVLSKMKNRYPNLTKDSPEIKKITLKLKERERDGYSYEGAESSFLLLVHEVLEPEKAWFELQNFHISEDATEFDKISSATVTFSANGKLKTAHATSESGPVDALDIATRGALGFFYPILKEVSLIDYKVRVLNPKEATGAHVRVLVTSRCGSNIITTVGVSEDILKASFQALIDSYKYILTYGGDL